MSISEPSLPSMPIRADMLRLREEDLAAIRAKIYHSSGDGYFIFRNFVSREVVQHMRNLWGTVDPNATHRVFPGKENIYAGCPDYYARYPDGSTIFYNFLFAEPLDEVTREVSVCVHMLRNRLSGRNAFSDLFGPRNAVSYRVTLNKNFENWIAPHTDFLDYEKRLEKGQYDPSRLQATLFLSRKGEDYSGVAFSMARNDGRQVQFGTDVDIEPGDLAIWKYTNLHGVSQITARPDQLGLLRIIFPIEDLHPPRGPQLSSMSIAEHAVLPYGELLKMAATRGVKGAVRRIRSALGA